MKMTSEELIVMTHNDLDALGSMLNIEFKFPSIKKKYFHTNYSDTDVIVQEIEDHIKKNGNNHIFIADVSFADNKNALRKLYKLGNCTLIDHHLYPDGFWDEFPDMKIVWDKYKCATLLCNEYLGNTGKNVGLDNLSKIIDIYDLWQTGHEAFDFSQGLNDYFWRTIKSDDSSIGKLTQRVIDNNYKLPDDFDDMVKVIKHEYEMAISGYEKRGLIYRSGGITLAFINDWFNQIVVPDMRNGQDFVIGINPYGIIRVRVRQESIYSDDQLDNLRLVLTGTKTTGHKHAFAYKMQGNVKFDDLMKEAQRVVTEIGKL